MKITVLMENHAPDALVCEHGLSLHMEYRGRNVLLDAGASGRFAENAAALGVDLSAVELAVLSHGHWDHADGLGAFFEANARARLYARPAILEPEWLDAGGEREFIGVNPALLERYAARLDLDDGPREILPGLHLVPDAVAHEQSLVAETARGLVVMNSCCHAGAGYIVRDLLERFPGQKVHAVLGGFHLMGLRSPDSLGVAPGIVKNLGRWLCGEMGVEQIYTGHCTGGPAFALLMVELGDKVHHLQTGDTISFED